MIFVQKLTISLCFRILFLLKVKHLFLKNNFSNKIFFFDSNIVAYYILRLFFGNLRKFNFKFNDIMYENQPIIGYRVRYVDLNNVVDDIYKNSKYEDILLNESFEEFFKFYLKKAIAEGMIKNSICIRLYALNVVNWYCKKNKIEKVYFIPADDFWFDELSKYAFKLNINLLLLNFISNRLFKIFIRYNLKFYLKKFLSFLQKVILFSYIFLKRKKLFEKTINNKIGVKHKILVQFFSNFNLDKPELYSDLFFYQSGKISAERIVLSINNINHLLKLKDYKIIQKLNSQVISILPKVQKIINIPISSFYLSKGFFVKNKFKLFNNLSELKFVQNLHYEYNFNKNLYLHLFKETNCKIHFTHFRFSNRHAAIQAALDEIGGINVLWQQSIDGVSTYDLSIVADVYFSSSNLDYITEKNNGSKIKYHVITGYPGDYRYKILRNKNHSIIDNFRKLNVKKVISFFDENSGSEERWDSGCALDNENYKFLLERILEDKSLAILFKPKKPQTIFKRLDKMKNLLDQALATKRCHFFIADNTTIPPSTASCLSDLSIHNSVVAPTAGIESILGGTTTFYMDHDNWNMSRLYQYGKDRFIFNDWNKLWDSVEEFFKRGNKNLDNYYSEKFLNELDPFRDGKAVYRIGEYLSDLLNGFDQGMDKEKNLEVAAYNYSKRWGDIMIEKLK